MKIVVTGASGFIGSHVADALTNAGHDVVLFDIAASPFARDAQTAIVGDILDMTAIETACAHCDAVYHFAALANIDEAIDHPRRSVELNVLGTLNALSAAHACGVRRFIFASSIYVYSRKGSFYKTTKQAAENLVFDFRERYNLDFTILRFGSLYGPRASMENTIHRIISQALQENRIQFPGTGEEVREYIHVYDAAEMAVTALSEDFRNEIVHLTGRERMKTADIVVMIREIIGEKVDVSFDGLYKEGHYIQTPYSYIPRNGRKLTKKTYIDFGLGLLECVEGLDVDADSSVERPS